jgi:hypothetical protein
MAVRISRTSARSAAALAKDRRSVLMKGIDRRFHPKILRSSSHFIAAINPDRHPSRWRQRHKSRPAASPASHQRRLATRSGAPSSTGSTVQDSGSGRHSKSGRCGCTHERSAPATRLGLPGGGPTPPLPVAHPAYFWVSDLAYSADCALTTPQTSSLKAAIQSVCGTHLLPSHISIRVLPPPP